MKQDSMKEVKKRLDQREQLTKEDLELLHQVVNIQIWWQKITGRFKK